MSRAIADVPVRTESVPTSEFGGTTDIRQTSGHEHLIGPVLLSSAITCRSRTTSERQLCSNFGRSRHGICTTEFGPDCV